MPRLAMRLLHAGLRDVAVRAVPERPQGRPQHHRAEPERVDDALAGNLCRCTGYAPIVAAAHRMLQLSRGEPDRLAAERPDTVARLRGAAGRGDGRGRRAARAASTRRPRRRAGRAPARASRGADRRRRDRRRPVGHQGPARARPGDRHLGGSSELQRIERPGRRARDRRRRHLRRRPARAGRALSRTSARCSAGSAASRCATSARIGGNIANGSPIGDSPPLLIALGARLVLRQGQARRELPLEDFFIDYGKQDRQAVRVRRDGSSCRSRRTACAFAPTRSPSASIRTSRRCSAPSR